VTVFPTCFPDYLMRLTKQNVSTLEILPGKAERIVFDEKLAGFGVRVRAGGKRTWIAQYRLGDKQRRLTLGNVESIDEKEARDRARKALGKVSLGLDPQLEKETRRSQAAETLAKVVDLYLAQAKRELKPRSFEEVNRHLTSHWSPIADRPIATLTRRDIAMRLSEIAVENGPFASNRARASLSALFSWAIAEGLAEANPVVGTNKATNEITRDRVLSPDELRTVWACAGDGQYGAIIRLLILTGQRREEVGGMRWAELDLDGAIWNLPPSRTKNGLPHDVPLSETAVEILRAAPRVPDREYVFGIAAGPFQGWSKAKEALDARIVEALRLAGHSNPLPAWRLHDLRRTVATRLGDIGILPHVVETVLNHISGHRAGVAGIYNRATYAIEKREALRRWAEHLLPDGA
jgi:integrase